MVCGVGIEVLYRCDPLGIQQNCLQNLPAASIVANMVRLCYAVVCVTSYPLCLAPLADMSEKALCACEGAGSTLEASRSGSAAVHQEPEKQERGLRKESGGGGAGGPTRGGGSSCDGMEWNRFVVPMRLLVMRLALVLAATLVSIYFPDFGLIVAIIGSFSVSLLSFVLPSAMHLAVVTGDLMIAGRVPRSSLAMAPRDGSEGGRLGVPLGEMAHLSAAVSTTPPLSLGAAIKLELVHEGVLLVLGIATCALTTFLTVFSFLSSA